ncbi:AAA family ATPase [Xanthomonas sp. CFBP 8703]|uniref:AAA family ATPase n=1 Tax=Xanthomonas bonasiae TaxID=2810351 RepID=A0ABS3AWR7_9XANT|nr:AAA family ATPase [Xanthomonas bonasiae]MBN6100582.1 AAA family ATPase [Xanthomonas bonasiae]
MSRLQVTLEAIQHVANLNLDVDLATNSLMCIVGRNGAGKTTLVRALKNLSNADTFVRTATPYAFSANSRIVYDLDGAKITFAYDSEIRSLNCRDQIPAALRDLIAAELPMPYGARFNFFRSASEADLDIRKSIALETYRSPDELISFLNSVYETDHYSKMVEVRVKGKSFYALVRENGTYIREDYLSSGEHFLINLYRTIKGPSKLLVIDEIDLSLDAAAQANLPAWLRGFCAQYDRKILFTTHSLALMQQLEVDELFYMDGEAGHASIRPTSYSYAMARLFGFVGFDRYIVAEDKKLISLIHHLVKRYCPTTLLSYKVIYIGGASQVAGLIESNESDRFLAAPEKVIAILDGDQYKEKYAQHASIHTLPLESVEKALWAARQDDPAFPFITPRNNFTSDKDFENHLKEKKIATQEEIFDYLIKRYEVDFQKIAKILDGLLPPPHG